MLVSLVTGHRISRNESLKLFKVRRSNPYLGPSDNQIGDVIHEFLPAAKLKWTYISLGDLLVESFRFLKKSKLPALITFAAKLKGFRAACFHTVVVTRLANDRIYALDPLGEKPEGTNAWNIIFPQNSFVVGDGRFYSIAGTRYFFDNYYEVTVITLRQK